MPVFDGSVFSSTVFETGDVPNVATGSFAMNGSGALTGFPSGVAAGAFALAGSAVGTNEIRGVASGAFELAGSAKGFASRFIGRLSKCGHPLSTACQDWLLEDQ